MPACITTTCSVTAEDAADSGGFAVTLCIMQVHKMTTFTECIMQTAGLPLQWCFCACSVNITSTLGTPADSVSAAKIAETP